MNEQLLNRLYRLRTHPFAPTVDETGAAFANDVFGASLNPQSDPRTLKYYFDVYDWTRFEVASGLKALIEAAENKLVGGDLLQSTASPIMVLITGFDDSGRESMLNLLWHVLSIKYPGIISFAVDLADLANENNVLTLAEIFLYTYNLQPPAPTRTTLKEVYDGVTQKPAIGPDTAYHNLFQIWRAQIPTSSAPPFATILRGKVSRDTWRVIYNSSRSLFQIFIVLTHQDDYADACFNALSREGRNVALVKAQYLDKSKAKGYIRWRLSRERLDQPLEETLSPFTDEAIEALFERGTQSDRRAEVTFPVGFVNKTLRRAMDDKLTQLASSSAPEAQGQQLLIREQDIRAVRQAINLGR